MTARHLLLTLATLLFTLALPAQNSKKVRALKAQRAQREAAGRLAILLAQQAQEVVRVFCGIPTRIK